MFDSERKKIILSSKNPYHILGIRESAQLEEISSAYRKLMLRFHPDKNKDPDSTEISSKINKAYECIILGSYNPAKSKENFDKRRQEVFLPKIIQLLHLKNLEELRKFVSDKNNEDAISSADNGGLNVFHHLVLFFADDYDFAEEVLKMVTPHLSVNTPSTIDRIKFTPLHFLSMASIHTMNDMENKIKLFTLLTRYGANINEMGGIYRDYDGKDHQPIISFSALDFVDLATEGFPLKKLYMTFWKEKGALHAIDEISLSHEKKMLGMLLAVKQINFIDHFQAYKPSFLQSLLSSSKYTLPIVTAISLKNLMSSTSQTSSLACSSLLLIAGGVLLHQVSALPEVFDSYSRRGYQSFHSKALEDFGKKLGAALSDYGLFQKPRQMIASPSTAAYNDMETQQVCNFN